MKIDVNFPIYATSLLCFIGWMILCFFLPTGMWGIPFDWIGAWAQRPIVMDEGTFKMAKGELADKVQLLMNEGKSLNEQKKKVEEERWSCNKWGTQRKLNNEQHKFETNCMIGEGVRETGHDSCLQRQSRALQVDLLLGAGRTVGCSLSGLHDPHLPLRSSEG